jgi:hypothetical protein
VVPGFESCSPFKQRGHIVVYTPQEVREILAGAGSFRGRVPPFIRTSRRPVAEDVCVPFDEAAEYRAADLGADNMTVSGHGDRAEDDRPTRYTPVVLFADLGDVWFENVAMDWVLHDVFTPRNTKAFIAAVIFHHQNLTDDSPDMDAAREYLRIPGVLRVMSTYLISERGVESCDYVQRLADVVQPHMLIATADEHGTRHCTAAVLSQRCYGADKHCGAGGCVKPVTLAEFYGHGGLHVAHVPTWGWPGAEPRPMRRADAPPPPAGWHAFTGFSLPFAESKWAKAARAGEICQRYEPKAIAAPHGVYLNENLRPLDCYDNMTAHRCLLAPPPMPLIGGACPAPPPNASQFWAFPPRNAYPVEIPPLERPRRLVWSFVGAGTYGDRLRAKVAFQNVFAGMPWVDVSQGMSRFDSWGRVICDAVFIPIGGGTSGYETARPFEAARCGTIPVVASGADRSTTHGKSTAADAASAYTTLLGFERRWPDGWIVGVTWDEAATLARRALETPGEVQRLRRQVLASHARMQRAMNARTQIAVRRAADPDHFWDEAAAARAIETARAVEAARVLKASRALEAVRALAAALTFKKAPANNTKNEKNWHEAPASVIKP